MNAVHAIFTGIALNILIIGAILYIHPTLLTFPWAVVKHSYLMLLELQASVIGVELPMINYVSAYFSQTPYDQFSYNILGRIEGKLYHLGGWLPSICMILFGFQIIRHTRENRYRKSHDFESLLEQETHYWRFNRYLTKVNPFDYSNDIKKSIFRMGEMPTEFLEKRKLLVKSTDAPSKVIRPRAKKVFLPTLGNLIAGLESFSEKERIILAIFLSVVHPERGGLDKPGEKYTFTTLEKLGREYAIRGLCGDISFSISGEMSESAYKAQVDEILEKCWDSPYIKDKLKRHAFTQTFIRGVYIDVKRGGVFPPSYIAWMKMWDRNLFYNLQTTGVPGNGTDYVKKENQPGKQIEVSLIVRHYISERVANRAIPKPEIDLLLDDIDLFLERKFEMVNGI